MRFRELISELFDKAFTWKWVDAAAAKADNLNYRHVASFEAHDLTRDITHQYCAWFYRPQGEEQGFYIVSFGYRDHDSLDPDKPRRVFRPVRTGHGFRVYATLADIVTDFVKRSKVHTLYLEGHVADQTRIYGALADRFIPRLPGWRVERRPAEDAVVITKKPA